MKAARVESLIVQSLIEDERGKEKSSRERLRRGIIHTEINAVTAAFLVCTFLILIFAVPLVQLAFDFTDRRRPEFLGLFSRPPSRATLKDFEEALEKSSVLRKVVQPRLQYLMTSKLGFGNVHVVMGRNGWLFYHPGVEYVFGPGLLDHDRSSLRAKRMIDAGATDYHPNPLPAILQFARQCSERGARLLLVPVPSKVMLAPDRLSSRLEFDSPVVGPNNADFQKFLREVRQGGVEVFDPTPPKIAPGETPFLRQDTHWTPEWMEQVARELAAYLKPLLPPAAAPRLAIEQQRISRVGDLVDMLRLPDGQSLFSPETITIRRVVDQNTGMPWQPGKDADVLFLGDSYSNIFSYDLMGWGDSAGFVEHVAYALQRPLDRVVRNDSGAYATRQVLSQELARGENRLKGKRFVVWEFAIRELLVGDWRPIDLRLGNREPSRFITIDRNKTLTVRGIIQAVSPAPRPGTVPYKDHIVQIHLIDLESNEGPVKNGHALIYTWSMRDNTWSAAARYRPGQRLKVLLKPWAEVEAQYGAINRTELDDEALSFEEPCWGEEMSE